MTNSWVRFRDSFQKLRRRNQYEYLGSHGWSPLRFYLWDGKPTHALVFTKAYLVENWFESEVCPSDLMAIVRYGMPTRLSLEMVQSAVKRWGLRPRFVGDLDPMDLSVFAAYRRGNSDLRKSRGVALPIAYGGIDDRWLELCERSFKAQFTLKHVCIKMERWERMHFAAIDGMLDLGEWVGPRCLSMLREGFKLELEGASNPAFYRRGFATKLLRHILG